MAKALLGKAFGIFRGYATEPLTVAFSVVVLPVFLFAVWWLAPLGQGMCLAVSTAVITCFAWCAGMAAMRGRGTGFFFLSIGFPWIVASYMCVSCVKGNHLMVPECFFPHFLVFVPWALSALSARSVTGALAMGIGLHCWGADNCRGAGLIATDVVAVAYVAWIIWLRIRAARGTGRCVPLAVLALVVAAFQIGLQMSIAVRWLAAVNGDESRMRVEFLECWNTPVYIWEDTDWGLRGTLEKADGGASNECFPVYFPESWAGEINEALQPMSTNVCVGVFRTSAWGDTVFMGIEIGGRSFDRPWVGTRLPSHIGLTWDASSSRPSGDD